MSKTMKVKSVKKFKKSDDVIDPIIEQQKEDIGQQNDGVNPEVSVNPVLPPYDDEIPVDSRRSIWRWFRAFC